MRKDFGAAFDEVTSAAKEQAQLSEAPVPQPSEPTPEPATPRLESVPVATVESALERFQARLAGRGEARHLTVHGIEVELPPGADGKPVQTTVRMDRALREAIRVACSDLECTFEEFVRDAVGIALEAFSGVGEDRS